MLEVTVEQRVTDLEALMVEVWRTLARVDRQIERTQHQVEQTQRQVDRLSREMREFKDEMLAFKDEMREFKDEMLAFKDEMREFKDEMRAFKDEMLAFKDEMREFKDEMLAFKNEMREFKKEINKKWGDLANKMGTMAEDLVAPSVPRILRQIVDCPDGQVESMAVHVRRLHPVDRREREFDVVAVCGEYVLINETKSRLNTGNVDDFIARMPEAREFFPEYSDKKFIGAIASLYVDESVVRYGERQGLIVLGFGEGVMEVLNSPGFRPKAF